MSYRLVQYKQIQQQKYEQIGTTEEQSDLQDSLFCASSFPCINKLEHH